MHTGNECNIHRQIAFNVRALSVLSEAHSVRRFTAAAPNVAVSYGFEIPFRFTK